MDKDLYITGEYTLAIGRIRIRDSGEIYPLLSVLKNGIKVAFMYYHRPAKQIVLDIEKGVTLTKETIDKIDAWGLWDFKQFKTVRKMIRSWHKQHYNLR